VNKIFALFCVLTLSACASLGPKFEAIQTAPKDKALVYVYRPSRFGGAARSPDVYANEVRIGSIGNGGFFSAQVMPGKTQMQFGGALGGKSKGVSGQLAAGQVYFFRVDFSLAGFDQHVRPDLVSTGEACTGGKGIAIFKLLTSDQEIKDLIAATDTRAQKDVCVPGMMFVTEDFAVRDLKNTKQSGR
jgi:hypothetical protein